MSYDLIISGALIVCMDPQMRVLEGHSVAIKDGKIAEIFAEGTQEAFARDYLDASGTILIPGMINAHTHLGMTYFRGLADDLPLAQWLGDYIWPLEAKLVNRQFVYDATLHGAAEMIKNGITAANDMYFQMSAVADACLRAGTRCMVSEALIEPMLSEIEKDRIGAGSLSLKSRYAGEPRLSFSLAPHAIYTCGDALLRKVAKIAGENDMTVHMHLSETEDEVTNCLAKHGKRPVEYLRETGLLDCRTVFAHGVWVSDMEMEILAEKNASIAICTDSNLKLASGIAPISKYLKHGVNLCLATDGVASNNNLDLLAEMDITAKLHKVIGNDPAILPAVELVRMATINGAKALGWEQKRGSIEIGKDADLTIIGLDTLENQPMYNPYSHLVYTISSSSVRDVLVGGKFVLRDRVLVSLDEAELIATANEYKEVIKKEIEK